MKLTQYGLRYGLGRKNWNLSGDSRCEQAVVLADYDHCLCRLTNSVFVRPIYKISAPMADFFS